MVRKMDVKKGGRGNWPLRRRAGFSLLKMQKPSDIVDRSRCCGLYKKVDSAVLHSSGQ